jgi:hypothetical protein
MRRYPRCGRSIIVAFVCATLAAIAGVPAAPNAGYAAPPDGALLRTLRVQHPRLIAHDDDIQRLRQITTTDPVARDWLGKVRDRGTRLLGEPPVQHKVIGPRMLTQSRNALERVYTWALLYRLEGDRRFADRARSELLTVAAFRDWNPSHFLDVAEMAHAVAIGYDWLYDVLPPDDRVVVRRSLITLALRPVLDLYRAQRGWVVAEHNWNQVCNGGMVVAALAIAGEEPDLATAVITQAVESVKRAMRTYAPDGAWPEGPGYWNYATRYAVYLLAAVEGALGSDLGLTESPGFEQTGLFRLHVTGPTGRMFNFADGGEREEVAPMLFWMSRRFDRPLYAWIERQFTGRPHPLDLVWFDPRGEGPRASRVPPDAWFRGIDTVFMRSAWEDPNAVFVGFKGGNNRANHSHLDLGTFVLDADGQRWAVDLGADDYDLPEYFGRQRWTYYRLRTEGHNTLVINGENQDPAARAPIVAYSSEPDRTYAVADLSAGYRAHASRVRRGVALLDRRHVLVQDEIEAAAPLEIVWTMHTPAEISLDGPRATLRLRDRHLVARILEPAGAHFAVLPASPPPPQAQNQGIVKLVVRLPGRVPGAHIAVVLSPSRDGTTSGPTPAVIPLAAWTPGMR